MRTFSILVVVAALLAPSVVLAQPVASMMDACGETAQRYFRDYEARTEMRYNGARVDGVQTVGGDIYLETRSAYIACAFTPDGSSMIEFFVDGVDETSFVSHGAHPHGTKSDRPEYFTVTGVAYDDVLNLRRDPSPHADIVGALGNGDRVRNLGCREVSGGRWCRVGLLDEMGGSGWVNARYLEAEDTPASSGHAINHGSLLRNRCAEAVAREVGVSPDDVIVTSEEISEGTGLTVIRVGVPYGQADWVCEMRPSGEVVSVFYGG